jgi:hypothetical protein
MFNNLYRVSRRTLYCGIYADIRSPTPTSLFQAAYTLRIHCTGIYGIRIAVFSQLCISSPDLTSTTLDLSIKHRLINAVRLCLRLAQLAVILHSCRTPAVAFGSIISLVKLTTCTDYIEILQREHNKSSSVYSLDAEKP